MLTDINVKIFNVRFVVEQRNKKKYKKPSVIHALGNIKWGFRRPQGQGSSPGQGPGGQGPHPRPAHPGLLAEQQKRKRSDESI